MKQTDCIGYEPKEVCGILSVTRCKGYDCVFFKTQEEDREIKKKVMKRIASLDILKQQYIAAKYYDGQMPWLNGDSK